MYLALILAMESHREDECLRQGNTGRANLTSYCNVIDSVGVTSVTDMALGLCKSQEQNQHFFVSSPVV